MKNILKKLIPLLGLAIVLGLGCRKQDESYSIVPQQHATTLLAAADAQSSKTMDAYIAQSWYNLMMKLIVETPGHAPPVAARSFGYTGVALYEAVMGNMPQHQSLAGHLNGLNKMPPRKYGNSIFAPVAANAALAKIIKFLFQNASAANLTGIGALEAANEQLYATQISKETLLISRAYGHAVAEAVYKWSVTDGGDKAYLNNFPTDYLPPAGVDKWVPTPPSFQNAMLPYWGNNRPMLSADEPGRIDPPAPPVFSTTPGSPFYNAAYEVYYTGLHLSSEQNNIALYWSDGGNTFTPPGHNVAIALQMIRNLGMNLHQAALLLAKVGIALNEASIVCWRAKYHFNLIRPISYIRLYIDTSWISLVGTPPFPTYTSGHATFSAAAAAILSAELGSQLSFTDSTKIADGFSPRTFSTFNDYAQEAAISRLYGGIHYRFDNENGFACGQLIAANVERLPW